MSHHPPHLPPKASSLRGYYVRQSILWMSVLVVLSTLAGIAGSLITIAWITPDLSRTDGGQIFFNGRKNSSEPTPAPTLMTQVYQRLVRVYDTTKIVRGTVYPKNAMVGQAAMLSSDGWGVMVLPDGVAVSASKQWVGVDTLGAEYAIDTLFTDPVSGLTYIKFQGNGFRVVSFADTPGVGWSTYARQWRMVDMTMSDIGDGALLPSASFVAGIVSPSVSIGSSIVNDEGMLLGFVGKNSVYIPSWIIRLQLGNVLREGRVVYTSLPWSGRWVDGVMLNGRFEHVAGWYVERGVSASTTVRVGDIVTRVNGRSVSPQTIVEQILEAPQSFSVTVWREGQEIDVPVEKQRGA